MRTVAVLAILTLVAGCTAADEPEQAGTLTDAEFTSLVNALVSPNQSPIADGPSRVELPDDWNVDGQRKVEDAWRRLAQAGPRAIPFLIERIDDERYSITWMHGLDTSHYNLTVGEACRSILREIVVPYSRYREIEARNSRPPYPPNDKVELRNWWRKHEVLSQFEIQRAAFDWIIDHDRNSDDQSHRVGLSELMSERDRFLKNGKPVRGSSEWESPLIKSRQ